MKDFPTFQIIKGIWKIFKKIHGIYTIIIFLVAALCRGVHNSLDLGKKYKMISEKLNTLREMLGHFHLRRKHRRNFNDMSLCGDTVTCVESPN